MKIFRGLCAPILLLVSLNVVSSSYAQDKEKNKKIDSNGTVDKIREPDPPKESTGTAKGSELNKPTRKEKPAKKEPPPPKK